MPSYNSFFSLKKTINTVIKALKLIKIKYEIIVIDDFSNDKTFEKLNKLKLLNKIYKLKIYRNKKNLGFALSCLKGAKKSKFKYVKILHSGNIESVYDLKKYFNKIDNYSVLLSYPDKNCKRNIIRKLVSKTCSIIIKILSGLKLEFYQSPILCARADFIKFFPKNYGNFFLGLMIVKLIYAKRNYVTFPIKFNYKKGSTAISIKNLYSLISSLFSILVLRFKN